MSDSVLITLIIAAAVIIILVLFRERLSAFLFKASSEGLEAELRTGDDSPSAESRPGVSVRGAKMVGSKQEISVRGNDAEVRDTRFVGKNQRISVDTTGDGEADD